MAPDPADEAEEAAPSSPPKPLLASEALREDLAPREPLGGAARAWCGALGAVFVGFGVEPFVEANTPMTTAYASFGIGAATIATGALPLGYTLRAALMVAAALACGILGMFDLGPAMALGHVVGPWGAFHLVAAIALPAALLFRARYRAYGPARVILAIALALALPFVVHEAVLIAGAEMMSVRIAAGVAIAAVALGAFGFTGSETAGAGGYIAALAVASIGATIAVPVLAVLLEPGEGGLPGVAEVSALAWPMASVVAFWAATVLGALGAFQLLAAKLWDAARMVDVHAAPRDRPSLRSLPDWPSSRR